jgi:predicted O-methyltransferase YrrM
MHPLTLARAAVAEHGAMQKDQELASFAALVMDLEPKVIVEIGSDAGGTLWLWQQLAPRVIGITLEKAWVGVFSTGRDLDAHDCDMIIGDSHDVNVRHELEVTLGGEWIDVLFIDGDHSYQGAKTDFEMYSPLVRPGGIVAFHDIMPCVNLPEIQVSRFWNTLDGDKEEIVVRPDISGYGIGVLRIPEKVAV